MFRILALPALALALTACNRDDNGLDKLERRVAALEEGSVVGSTDDTPDWDGEEPSNAVEELEERVEDVEEGTEEGAETVDGLVEDLDALTARLEALEADVAAIEPGTRVSTRYAADVGSISSPISGGDTRDWENLGGASIALEEGEAREVVAFCRARGKQSSGIDMRVVLLDDAGSVVQESLEAYGVYDTETRYELRAQALFTVDGAASRIACQGRWAQLFLSAEVLAIVLE